MKRTAAHMIGGLAMLLGACSGTPSGNRQEEMQTQNGFEITYSPDGFTIEGEDRHGHDVFYSWWSFDGSGHLSIIRQDTVSVFEDTDGDDRIDVYGGPNTSFHTEFNHVDVDSWTWLRPQSIYREHTRILPVDYAQQRWDQRWRSGPHR